MNNVIEFRLGAKPALSYEVADFMVVGSQEPTMMEYLKAIHQARYISSPLANNTAAITESRFDYSLLIEAMLDKDLVANLLLAPSSPSSSVETDFKVRCAIELLKPNRKQKNTRLPHL